MIIKLRRGTEAEWDSSNPVLASGEVGVETSTNKFKIGDGETTWALLDYYPGPTFASIIEDALSTEISTRVAQDINIATVLNTISASYLAKIPGVGLTQGIRTVNGIGPDSNGNVTLNVLPPTGTPEAPTNLVATAVSTTQINITWSVPSGATSVDLEIDGVVQTGQTSPKSHTGLTQNTTHQYRARGVNASGNGAWSSIVSATTQPTYVGPFAVAGTSIANTAWTPVWSDEFDDPSTITTEWGNPPSAKWLAFEGNRLNNGWAKNTNYEVANSILSLWTTPGGNVTGADIGYVSSAAYEGAPAGHNFVPGEYVEARVRSKGPSTTVAYNWDAFWTDGPHGLEFDAFEMLGDDGNRAAHVVYHPDGDHQSLNSTIAGEWFNAWHVIGIDRRSAGSVKIYYDGVLKETIDTAGEPDNAEMQAILLNSGRGTQKDKAHSFDVDWVRVWRPTT